MIERVFRRLKIMQQRFLATLGRRGIVLVYHRIGSANLDPFEMFVSIENFSQQMEVLSRRSTLLSLGAMHLALRENRLPPNAVAVTFDDGYRDIVTVVAPVLRRLDVPATAFVVSDAGLLDRGFWWDELANIAFLAKRLPVVIRHSVGARIIKWEFELGGTPRKIDMDTQPVEVPASERAQWLRSLHRTMFVLPADEQGELMEHVRGLTQLTRTINRNDLPVTPDEIRLISDGGLFDIGSHTCTHPYLPALPLAERYREISNSRQRLEDITGRPIESFAYPYGSYDRHTVAAVRDAGYKCACTNIAYMASYYVDPMLLPRFVVSNVNGDEFARSVGSHLRPAV
jgi:peptidoglycan/xylan/chitin deacetylase (PgdA/CDA1 family)